MRFWSQLPQGGWSASASNVRIMARLAEEVGLDGAWLGDHIVIPIGYQSQYPYGELHPVAPDRPFLEAYTVLSYLAGQTTRLRLAVTVAIAPYRHPLLHARIVATLDYLSGGRLEVGVGSGWLREEFEALGLNFERRFAITNEYVDVMQSLWTGEVTSADGPHISFSRVQCLPRPVQRPHPKLWIGGSGKSAFDSMVRFNAGWLGPDLPVSQFLDKLGVFQARIESSGRSNPGVSAKLWVEPAAERRADSLSISWESPTNFALLETLAAAGTTDVRLDLSRLSNRDRPGAIIAVAKALRAAGLLATRGSADATDG